MKEAKEAKEAKEEKKALSTHEFAKLLLSKEDTELYIHESYEVQGEHGSGFSTIIGLNEDVVEKGLVIDYDYLAGNPNSHRYRKGDATVYIDNEGNKKVPEKLYINLDDILYMLISKATMYHSWHVDRIGFYEDPEVSHQYMLDHKLLVVMESGFKTETKEMTLDEAVKWYKEEFAKELSYY